MSPKSVQKVLIGIAALAALALGGSALAGAATSTTPNTTFSTTRAAAPDGPRFMPGNAPGTAAHETSEKAVTGEAAEKAKAAAIASAGGGTADAVTSNYTGDGYEVTVTKTDGSQVSMHLDGSFKVESHPGPGGPGGPPAGQAPQAG